MFLFPSNMWSVFWRVALWRFGSPRFCNLHWWESFTFLRWTSPKLSNGWSRGLRADGRGFFSWLKKRSRKKEVTKDATPLTSIWTNSSPIIVRGERWSFHIESVDRLLLWIQLRDHAIMHAAFFKCQFTTIQVGTHLSVHSSHLFVPFVVEHL